jgi:WD40 repeat protein
MDGCTLASASKDGSVIVWDTQSKQILHSFKKRIGATDVEITNIQVLYISKKHFETSDFDDKTIRLSIQPFSKFAIGDDVERDKNVAIKMTMNMEDDDVMDILEDEIFDSCLVENISSVDPFKKKNFDPILIKVQNAYLETLKTSFDSRKKKK